MESWKPKQEGICERRNIIERSYVLEQLLESGAIGIVGAMHNIETGKVTFYDDVTFIKDEINPDFSFAKVRSN